MSSTRSSTDNRSSPMKDTVPGTKRKADPTSPERSRKSMKQATIEETLAGDSSRDPYNNTVGDAKSQNIQTGDDSFGKDEVPVTTNTEPTDKKKEAVESRDRIILNDIAKPASTNTGAVQESRQCEKEIASNILEKGIVYFFTRNRVGIEDSDSVDDLQRTHFVLRPLPIGAKLGDGALPDTKNNRLLALPKKVLPRDHNDRFMAFVEKANTTIQSLKDEFFKGDQYDTQTQGTRRVEPIATVAEGVYFITRTDDRSTHFVYAITIPSELGEVQEDIGLKSQGSFVISVKNPDRPGPARTNLPQGPGFPQEIIDEFRGLAWSEVKPIHLDYANTQVLLIGEHTDNAIKVIEKDRKHGKVPPKVELDELEHEDQLRVAHLNGDDSIFDDLKISRDEYSKVPTTW